MIDKQSAADRLGISKDDLEILMLEQFKLDPDDTEIEDHVFQAMLDGKTRVETAQRQASHALAAAPGDQIEQAKQAYATLSDRNLQSSVEIFALEGFSTGELLAKIKYAAMDAAIAQSDNRHLQQRLDATQAYIESLNRTDLNSHLDNLGIPALPQGNGLDLSGLRQQAKALSDQLSKDLN